MAEVESGDGMVQITNRVGASGVFVPYTLLMVSECTVRLKCISLPWFLAKDDALSCMFNYHSGMLRGTHSRNKYM